MHVRLERLRGDRVRLDLMFGWSRLLLIPSRSPETGARDKKKCMKLQVTTQTDEPTDGVTGAGKIKAWQSVEPSRQTKPTVTRRIPRCSCTSEDCASLTDTEEKRDGGAKGRGVRSLFVSLSSFPSYLPRGALFDDVTFKLQEHELTMSTSFRCAFHLLLGCCLITSPPAAVNINKGVCVCVCVTERVLNGR